MAVSWGRRTQHHRQFETVVIERNTVTTDAVGGPSHSWASHITGVRARIHRLSGAESVRYGRDSTSRLWRVEFAGGQDVTAKDRVNWSSESKIMTILQIDDHSTNETTMRLVCEEIV